MMIPQVPQATGLQSSRTAPALSDEGEADPGFATLFNAESAEENSETEESESPEPQSPLLLADVTLPAAPPQIAAVPALPELSAAVLPTALQTTGEDRAAPLKADEALSDNADAAPADVPFEPSIAAAAFEVLAARTSEAPSQSQSPAPATVPEPQITPLPSGASVSAPLVPQTKSTGSPQISASDGARAIASAAIPPQSSQAATTLAAPAPDFQIAPVDLPEDSFAVPPSIPAAQAISSERSGTQTATTASQAQIPEVASPRPATPDPALHPLLKLSPTNSTVALDTTTTPLSAAAPAPSLTSQIAVVAPAPPRQRSAESAARLRFDAFPIAPTPIGAIPDAPPIVADTAPASPLPLPDSRDMAGSVAHPSADNLLPSPSAPLLFNPFATPADAPNYGRIDPLTVPPQVDVADLPNVLQQHAAKGANSPVELLLNPEELGRIRFEIRHTGDQVQVLLSTERPETQDLLRRHSDQLMSEFKQAGYSGASLSFGQWGQGQSSATPQPAPEQMPEAMPGDVAPTPPSAALRLAAAHSGLSQGQGLNLRL